MALVRDRPILRTVFKILTRVGFPRPHPLTPKSQIEVNVLVNPIPLYPLQPQAKVIKLQNQAVKTLFPPLKSLETFIAQKQSK